VTEFFSVCPDAKCFIPTPHRAQRLFIQKKLDQIQHQHAVHVDTVDKMQGQQAHCIIISTFLTDKEVIENEANFLYSLQRINVAMSRAQCLCILLTSKQFLSPSPEVLRNETSRAGYELLLSFKKASKAVLNIEIDCMNAGYSKTTLEIGSQLIPGQFELFNSQGDNPFKLATKMPVQKASQTNLIDSIIDSFHVMTIEAEQVLSETQNSIEQTENADSIPPLVSEVTQAIATLEIKSEEGTK